MSDGKKNSRAGSRMQSVEETNAALAKELADEAVIERARINKKS